MESFSPGLHYFLILWPIWLPVLMLNLAFEIWMHYIQRHWERAKGYVFMEIKLPKDQTKSPAAMELVLQGIWENANMSHIADAFWEGKMREWFSLEIVAIGGEVRFFIWAFPRWKKIIESRIYSQYPGAEVVEAKDYALDLHYVPGKTYMWGVNTAKVNKNFAVPINSYIEHGLDKAKGDEPEMMVDPLTPIIEYLGTFGREEFGCYQILIRAHAKENLLYRRLVPKDDLVKSKQVEKAIKEVIEKEAPVKPEEGKQPALMNLTQGQKDKIASIERNAGKLAFDSMVRLFYSAPQEHYDNSDKARGIGMIGSMRQFGARHLSGIKPEFFSFTHVWQDFNDIRKNERTLQFANAFKRRAYFGPEYHHLFHKPYVMSVEEVATLFHLPGAVATTPTLRRAPSKKAEAPANLPV